MPKTGLPIMTPPASRDRDLLRRLAGELAEIAALPDHAEKARLWTRLNDREPVLPMVWINEIPWHEMNVRDELTLRCADPWMQGQEQGLRRLIYQWRHLPADMIVGGSWPCSLAIHHTSFGIEEDVDVLRTDDAKSVVSRHFHRQIVEPKDLEKIKMAVVSHDVGATEARYQRMLEIYGGVLPVHKEGIKHISTVRYEPQRLWEWSRLAMEMVEEASA